MNQQWEAFLASKGARIEDGLSEFGSSEESIAKAANHTVLIPLTHLGLIRSRGEDSRAFLQGQLSNDVNALDNAHSQLSAYCNPKGRMLAQFRVVPLRDDEFLLILHRDLIESTLKRLRMFVLRSKVELEDVSDEIVCLGLSGAEAEKRVSERYASVPAHADDIISEDGDQVVRIADGDTARFLILSPVERAISLWEDWSAHTVPAGGRAWEWLDIHAGLPSIVPETIEAFVPLMLNLQHLNGVSFKKGCYPGQEIIARTHYLGKIKRRMYKAHSPADTIPAPGTDIYDAKGDGQSVGTVVNAQPAPDGGLDLLVVLQVSAEQGDLQLATDKAALELRSLPYSLEQAS